MAGSIKHAERSHVSCVHNYPVFRRKSYRGRWGYNKYDHKRNSYTVTKVASPAVPKQKTGFIRRLFRWFRNRLNVVERRVFRGIVR